MKERVQLFPYKPTHRIMIVGCDDVTSVEFALDPHELRLVEEIADMINAAAYESCQPTMNVTEIE